MLNGFFAKLWPRKKNRLTLIRCAPVWVSEAERVLDAEYRPLREELSSAGLDEAELRKMDPDERVAALEKARLNPYDFIFLAC